MPHPAASLLLLLLPVAACAAPMNLSAHMTEGNVSFSGTLERGPRGDGILRFSAPGGPECDGIVVPSTVRTPERLEGQIQCNDGRSGAIRMTLSPTLGVGSGRLGRYAITFRTMVAPRQQKAEPLPSRQAVRGKVTLKELFDDGLAEPGSRAR